MLKLAFLGMNEGNGHAFSWSAIINGRYDPEKMKECGYPVIYEYLSAQPPGRWGYLGPGSPTSGPRTPEMPGRWPRPLPSPTCSHGPGRSPHERS